MKTFRTRVTPAQDAESPRESAITTFAMAHRRMAFGDSGTPRHPDLIEAAREENDRAGGFSLSVYMLDHSGIRLSTTPFSCPWDSGRVGAIWVTPDDVRTYGLTRETAEDQMRAEIEALDRWISGDVWDVEVLNPEGDVVEAVYGVYGREAADQEAAEGLQGVLLEDLKDTSVAAPLAVLTSALSRVEDPVGAGVLHHAIKSLVLKRLRAERARDAAPLWRGDTSVDWRTLPDAATRG